MTETRGGKNRMDRSLKRRGTGMEDQQIRTVNVDIKPLKIMLRVVLGTVTVSQDQNLKGF